jgi:hypothetical protein
VTSTPRGWQRMSRSNAGTMARSTDDYRIFCMGNQMRAYLPGGRTIAPAPEPIWQLYSP